VSLLRFSTAVFLSVLLPLKAQQIPERIRVRGELVNHQPFEHGPLQIELRTLDGRSTVPSAVVHSDGTFELNGIEPGTYNAVIASPAGFSIHTSLVQVSAINNQITIRLDPVPPREATRGSVSFRQLSHEVPKAARKELERARERRERNQLTEALAHLRKAIEIDPDYLEAQNNLGTLYIRMGNLEAAHEPLTRAAELEPGAPEAQCNLSALALKEGNPVAAERHIRRAMMLGAEPVLAAYLLGLSLASQNRRAEAVPLLEEAGARFPHAREVLSILKRHQTVAPAPANAYRQR
jgi:hypothetical protein